jgi:hypothetical protein
MICVREILGGKFVNTTPYQIVENNMIPIKETIKKIDGKYVVYPKKGGRRLGTHDTRVAAQKQLAAIEISKHTRENINELYEREFCKACLVEYIKEHYNSLNEAEYQGRTVKLGKPFRTPNGPKKFSVYVKNKKGNVIKVNFGDPDMKIKKNIPARRKSFRARHKCHTAKDRTSARYWSCKSW